MPYSTTLGLIILRNVKRVWTASLYRLQHSCQSPSNLCSPLFISHFFCTHSVSFVFCYSSISHIFLFVSFFSSFNLMVHSIEEENSENGGGGTRNVLDSIGAQITQTVKRKIEEYGRILSFSSYFCTHSFALSLAS